MGNKAPEYMQDSVVVNAVKSIFQELRSGRNMMKGGDFYQVGGEFVFEDGRVTWCHRMRNTRDHAEVPEIRTVLGLDGDRRIVRKRWTTGLGRALSNRRQSWSRSRSGSRKKSLPDTAMENVAEDKRREDAERKGLRTTSLVLNVALDGTASGTPAVQASA